MADAIFASASADDARRLNAAQHAAMHIEALVMALRRNPRDDELVDAVTVRVEHLACAITSALTDPAQEMGELTIQVFGHEA